MDRTEVQREPRLQLPGWESPQRIGHPRLRVPLGVLRAKRAKGWQRELLSGEPEGPQEVGLRGTHQDRTEGTGRVAVRAMEGTMDRCLSGLPIECFKRPVWAGK